MLYNVNKEKIILIENNLESEHAVSIYIDCNVLNTVITTNLNYKG